MRLLKAALAVAGASAYLAAPPAPLRVLRATPADTAGRAASIEITFDRPVAGSLDRSVDPRTVVSVVPAVPGRLEWRDPVTIVLTPSGLLSAATRYTVTVGKSFQAMDGSRLAVPYSYSFRVRAPVLVGGSPAAKKTVPHYLTPTSGFALVYDGPVDLAQLSARASLAMDPSCAGGVRTITLDARAQRRLDKNDPWEYHDYRSPGDSLRRVVSLVPAAPDRPDRRALRGAGARRRSDAPREDRARRRFHRERHHRGVRSLRARRATQAARRVRGHRWHVTRPRRVRT